MYTDIYDDAMWLINLVENLLSVSRLEEGRMNLHVSTELIDEVVAEALRHINRKSAEYHLNVQNSEEYLLAQIDAKLIVQVIINIVDNAIKYTPPGLKSTLGGNEKEATSIFPLQITARESPTKPSRIFSICFTVRPIRLRIAAAAWGWAWHCANRLSMHMAEKSR